MGRSGRSRRPPTTPTPRRPGRTKSLERSPSDVVRMLPHGVAGDVCDVQAAEGAAPGARTPPPVIGSVPNRGMKRERSGGAPGPFSWSIVSAPTRGRGHPARLTNAAERVKYTFVRILQTGGFPRALTIRFDNLDPTGHGRFRHSRGDVFRGADVVVGIVRADP